MSLKEKILPRLQVSAEGAAKSCTGDGKDLCGNRWYGVPALGSLVPFPPVAVETGFEDEPRNFSITALIIWLPLIADHPFA
jgi:hypothetical protein